LEPTQLFQTWWNFYPDFNPFFLLLPFLILDGGYPNSIQVKTLYQTIEV